MYNYILRTVVFLLVWFFWLPGLMENPDDPYIINNLITHAKDFKKVYLEYFILEEILDKRQRMHYFFKDSDIESDLKYVRSIITNIAHLPKIRDFDLFSRYSREDVNNFKAVNREFNQRLKDKKELFGDYDGDIAMVIKHNEWLYQLYDDISDVKSEYYYVQVRRLAIGRIIEKIGYDNYFHGRIPPNLPIQHFQKIP